MNLNGLNFDSIPPFEVPSRFFMTAPLFGMLCAVIIGLSGNDLWFSRWHPSTLALTHAIVLGFISTIMCGAIFQLLPVLGGIAIPRIKIFATAVLLGLSSGTLLLVAGFFLGKNVLFYPAYGLLSTVFIVFIYSILKQLSQHHADSRSIQTIRIGFIAMLVVVSIAAVMLSDYLVGTGFNNDKLLTDNHAAWGLIGWISLIIIGVSFQVLPMFHVSPSFPDWSTKWLPRMLAITLTLNLVFMVSGALVAQFITIQFTKIILIIYGVTALRLLILRKRKISDISVTCWKIALSSLIISCLLSLATTLFDAIYISPLIIAGVFIFGWIISVIMAMIIKIMPFLAYLHLQQQCGCNLEAFYLLPNVHQLLNKQKMKQLLFCHIASLIMLLGVSVAPQYYYILAGLLFIQFGYLLFILLGVNNKYKEAKRAIDDVLKSNSV